MKETGICTNILDSVKIIAIFDGDQLILCGKVYNLSYCSRVNERYYMTDKIIHVQKMCIKCYSNYHQKSMPICHEVMALDKYSSVKKGLKKSSAVAKNNQETTLA